MVDVDRIFENKNWNLQNSNGTVITQAIEEMFINYESSNSLIIMK